MRHLKLADVRQVKWGATSLAGFHLPGPNLSLPKHLPAALPSRGPRLPTDFEGRSSSCRSAHRSVQFAGALHDAKLVYTEKLQVPWTAVLLHRVS